MNENAWSMWGCLADSFDKSYPIAFVPINFDFSLHNLSSNLQKLTVPPSCVHLCNPTLGERLIEDRNRIFCFQSKGGLSSPWNPATWDIEGWGLYEHKMYYLVYEPYLFFGVCMCVWCACVCAHICVGTYVCRWICMCVLMCGGLRLVSGVILHHCLPYPSRQSLSIELRAHRRDQSIQPACSGDPPTPPSKCWNYRWAAIPTQHFCEFWKSKLVLKLLWQVLI